MPNRNSAAAPGVNPWLVAVVVSMATFMEVLDTSIANVALPHIAGGLSAGQDEATWVLTSYLVSNAIILPISGWLATVIGRKRFYMSCVALFGISSFLCGIAPEPWLADCLPGAPGNWRRRTGAQRAVDPDRHVSARGNGAWRSRFTASPWLSPPRSGRRSADISPTTATGGGSSSSTCRWQCSRCCSPTCWSSIRRRSSALAANA